jgi:alpha-beta hydrolase superfamily lysophospholipase
MFSKIQMSCWRLKSLSVALAALVIGATAMPSQASIVRTHDSQTMIVRTDEPAIGSRLPLYEWKKAGGHPKAIAVAVHGLVMHGAVYDSLARNLAENDFVVYAPDLRGYGRWQHAGKFAIDYEQSYADLHEIVKSLKAQHPGLPMYVIGESLGADMALHVASDEPNLVSGLILSSPAIRRHSFIPSLAAKAGIFVLEPFKQFNLVPYIRRFASEDPRIVEETLTDPLVRKHLSAWELLRTCQYMKPSLNYAGKLPQTMPVLVIQGNKDRMVRTNGVALLLSRLRSNDQTVRWFADRGHLLLETGYLQPDTLATVQGWLSDHLGQESPSVVQATTNAEILATN